MLRIDGDIEPLDLAPLASRQIRQAIDEIAPRPPACARGRAPGIRLLHTMPPGSPVFASTSSSSGAAPARHSAPCRPAVPPWPS